MSTNYGVLHQHYMHVKLAGLFLEAESRAQHSVQCQRPTDCSGRCNGCLVNKCDDGLCICGCDGNKLISDEATNDYEILQCGDIIDCRGRCPGCSKCFCFDGACIPLCKHQGLTVETFTAHGGQWYGLWLLVCRVKSLGLANRLVILENELWKS